MRGARGGRMPALVVGVGATLLLTAGPAAASCAPPPPMEQQIEEAQTVFVGTVRETADEGYHATVDVEEVWKRADLPPRVEVDGSPGGSDGTVTARSSVDRTFLTDTRYLFVLLDAEAPFEDNACSGTSEWREEHARHRPADARKPVEGAGASGGMGAAGSGEPGAATTTGGDSGSQEPTMTGTGPDTPVDDDAAGEDQAELDEPAGVAQPGGESSDTVTRTDTEPVAVRRGVDGRLVAAMLAGFAALAGFGWWLRRDA